MGQVTCPVHHAHPVGESASDPKPQNGQLSLFTEYLPHPAVDSLRELKIETLTPLQAFDELRRLKQTTNDQ